MFNFQKTLRHATTKVIFQQINHTSARARTLHMSWSFWTTFERSNWWGELVARDCLVVASVFVYVCGCVCNKKCTFFLSKLAYKENFSKHVGPSAVVCTPKSATSCPHFHLLAVGGLYTFAYVGLFAVSTAVDCC